MERVNFAYMIGAERSGIRWGRPMIFFTSLFLGGTAATLTFQLFMRFFGKDGSTYMLLPTPFTLIDNFLSYLILAFVLLLFFYLIRNQLFALLAAAVFYAPIDAAINYLIVWIRTSAYSGIVNNPFQWMSHLFTSLTLVTCLVGGIILATYLIKQTWLAILIGAIVGRLLFRFSLDGYYFLTNEKFEFMPSLMIFSLSSSAVFAAAFWFGLRMTAEKTPLAEGEKPRLSKEFYVGTWAATTAIAIVSAIIAIIGVATGTWAKTEMPFAFLVLGIATLLAIYGAVVFSVLIYKMWAAIDDGHARTTPGKALGYLFIPFYNIYWMFQALPGFAEDYNAYVDRHHASVPHLSKGIFTAYCIAIICTVLPLIGFVANIVAIFAGIAMMAKICDAVNALPARNGGS